jgi:hypothetical protein
LPLPCSHNLGECADDIWGQFWRRQK